MSASFSRNPILENSLTCSHRSSDPGHGRINGPD